MPEKLTKVEKKYHVDDGNKRGPMTMLRVRFHPREAKLVAACADRRVALFDLAADADQEVKGRGKCVVGELVCPHEIGWVRGIDFHPDGKWLLGSGGDHKGFSFVIEPNTGKTILEEKKPSFHVHDFALRPDAKSFIAVGHNQIAVHRIAGG